MASPRPTEVHLHELFLNSLGGDAEAYRQFLRMTAVCLRVYLRRRLASWPDEVEDLVQEAMLAIHTQRSSYDIRSPLTAWVYAIARYKLFDWLRRYARQGSLHDPLDDDNAPYSSVEQDSFEARSDLTSLLARLPARQRSAIILTRLDGCSVRETAGALQMSEAAVKVSVHRGLKTLTKAAATAPSLFTR